MGTPLAAFALAQFDEEAFSQTSNAGAPPDVVDFWVDHTGVPAHMVLGAETTRGRRAQAGPQTSNLAREPLFLHYDPDEGSLIPADQIPSAKMHPFTDAKMDFQLVRMRLNPADHQQFSNYTSGGIYLDFQQGQPQSIFGELVSLATTSFSAIFPGAKSGAGASSGSKSGSKSGGKSASSGTSSGASKSPAAATVDGSKAFPEALRLKSGSYIVIPKEHSAGIKDQLGKLKILDGFLVPKEATSLDVFDAAPQTAQMVSYISLQAAVTNTKSGAKTS
jgi:hypothetical protein